MGQTQDESTQNPAERLCWEISWRDGCRLARRLYRTQLVKGVYRLDEGAALDDCFYFLPAKGVRPCRSRCMARPSSGRWASSLGGLIKSATQDERR
jgi:hypothetical protein